MKPYPWQQTEWKRWIARSRGGQMPHGILFSGPEGIGKEDFARAYAYSLLCESSDEKGVACGHCKACVMNQAGTHPDLMVVEPAEKGKAIVVDQIRELIGFLSLKPHNAQRKVALILQADRMNTNASNSLLKSLEEPPSASLLMLTSSRPASLLPTIRSRCQLQNFALPDQEIARIWLGARLPDAERASLYLALANHAPLRALAFAEENILDVRHQLLESARSIRQRKVAPVAAAQQWLKQGVETSLYWLGSFVADMARLAVSTSAPGLANPDVAPELREMAASFELYQLAQFQQRLERCERELQGNANAQLLLEEILITWAQLDKMPFQGVA